MGSHWLRGKRCATLTHPLSDREQPTWSLIRDLTLRKSWVHTPQVLDREMELILAIKYTRPSTPTCNSARLRQISSTSRSRVFRRSKARTSPWRRCMTMWRSRWSRMDNPSLRGWKLKLLMPLKAATRLRPLLQRHITQCSSRSITDAKSSKIALYTRKGERTTCFLPWSSH